MWVLEVDIGKVRRLRAEGFGLRVIAERMGISVNTLQKARGQARDSCGQSVSHSRSSDLRTLDFARTLCLNRVNQK